MATRTTQAAAGALIMTAAAAASAQYIGPTPYYSLSDSPFANPGLSFFVVEDFEGAQKPGYTRGPGQVLEPNVNTDSVDGDNGAVDGFGRSGRSWFSGGEPNGTTFFSFSFDAISAGQYPTHVGIVWTDVGLVREKEVPSNTSFGVVPVRFFAFDAGGAPIGPPQGYGPFTLGDGRFDGTTGFGAAQPDDHFIGIVHTAGVSRIEITVDGSSFISQDWEVDHLQFGANPIPEPEQWLLMALGLGAVAAKLRTRRQRRLPR